MIIHFTTLLNHNMIQKPEGS